LENAASIEKKEQYGGTPLAWAIECRSKWIVELLLTMGAKVDYVFIPTFNLNKVSDTDLSLLN
jgi:hypothetical protein